MLLTRRGTHLFPKYMDNQPEKYSNAVPARFFGTVSAIYISALEAVYHERTNLLSMPIIE